MAVGVKSRKERRTAKEFTRYYAIVVLAMDWGKASAFLNQDGKIVFVEPPANVEAL